MYQHITDQTRIIEGRNWNTIDLAFTTVDHMMKNLEIEPLH